MPSRQKCEWTHPRTGERCKNHTHSQTGLCKEHRPTNPDSVPETDSHKRYMQKYQHERYRQKLETSEMLAPTPRGTSPNYEVFYTKLYKRLGLEEYLPALLKDLEVSKRAHQSL